MQPLFLEPVFKEMIWGGTALRELFHYDIPGDKTGECWAVSAHKNGDCTVHTKTVSEYDGKTLSALWTENKELWGKSGEKPVFPLLTKIISAEEDLSIQVHPDDEYAKAHENGSLGKTECWYILDAKEGATIVIGHNAKDREELRRMVEERRFKELIKEIPIKKGDFLFIEPGTVHAIKAGTVLLETQQNSDITYRLYDYDRLQNGMPRELHLEKCMDVINGEKRKDKIKHRPVKVFGNGSYIRNLVTSPLFDVTLIKVTDEVKMEQNEDFTLVSVIEGGGKLVRKADNAEYEIKKGIHFILPYKFGAYSLTGDMEVVESNCNLV